jgi:SRSO17 transposase
VIGQAADWPARVQDDIGAIARRVCAYKKTAAQALAAQIMEFYRRRWQIELAFKRLKSLLQLGHLKEIDKDGARAWLQGKLLVACLIEKLILTAERFSPWGYAAQGNPDAGAPITLA